MSYTKALETLLALPVERRRFIAGDYQRDDGARCVLGELCPSTREVDGAGILEVATLHPSVSYELHTLGLTVLEAALMQYENDGFEGSDAARFEHVLEVVKEHAARESEYTTAQARTARRTGFVVDTAGEFVTGWVE